MSADNHVHVFKRPDGLFGFYESRDGFEDECPDEGYATPHEACEAAYQHAGDVIEYGVSFSDECFILETE